MIYTPSEYAVTFTFGGIHISERSIRRRCERGQLPAGHVAHKKRGFWVIEVLQFSGLTKNFNVTLTPKKETV